MCTSVTAIAGAPFLLVFAPVCGPACAPVCGPACAPVCGPACAPVCGPACAPVCGLRVPLSVGQHYWCGLIDPVKAFEGVYINM